MNMNFNQLAMIQKIQSSLEKFRVNHPKFPMFLQAVSREALVEGSVIEITVTTPEGQKYCSNIKLKPEDLELIDTFKNLGQQ